MARHHILAAIAAAPLALGATAPHSTSTLEGVYSVEQAETGRRLYETRCAMCHGRQLEGTYETPGLQSRFIVNWSKAPLGELYDYLGRAMPQFAPGSLKPDETASILAYLLSANAQPAGARPLPANADILRQITLAPLPPKAAPKSK